MRVLGIVVYVVFAVIMFRRAIWIMYSDFQPSRLAVGDWCFVILAAAFFGAVFALFVPLWALYKVFEWIVPRTPLARVPLGVIMSIPREEKLRLRENQLRERERHIEQLERNVGMK